MDFAKGKRSFNFSDAEEDLLINILSVLELADLTVPCKEEPTRMLEPSIAQR